MKCQFCGGDAKAYCSDCGKKQNNASKHLLMAYLRENAQKQKARADNESDPAKKARFTGFAEKWQAWMTLVDKIPDE